MAAAVAVASCGGDDDAVAATAGSSKSLMLGDSKPRTGSVPKGRNKAPLISGTPAPSVIHGSLYEFIPKASDPEGDLLTFSIANRPPWASFDTLTGRLGGVPGLGDVGTYGNITISVSDGRSTASLGPFGISVVGTALGSATLSWLAPTQRTDGTALTNLAGYRVYWGTSAGKYSQSIKIENPGISTYVVSELTPATWYFAVSAFDSKGVESEPSSPASKTIL